MRAGLPEPCRGMICLDASLAGSDIGARPCAAQGLRGLGGMVRTLRLLVWTLAWVGLWASAEQGAYTTPPAPAETLMVPQAPALPEGTWAKLRALFSEAPLETGVAASRKGRP
jgi:hypothetical protein